MYDSLVTTRKLQIDVNKGGISLDLYRIYREVKYIRIPDTHHNSIFENIYLEQWKNIRPRRCDISINGYIYHHTNNIIVQNNISHILTLFDKSFNYDIYELEVKKDIKAGAPVIPNNICQSCYMLLFDWIYVLEYNNCHVCICAHCMHIEQEDKKCNEEWGKILNMATILKVKYPVTIIDIINNKLLGLTKSQIELFTTLSQYTGYVPEGEWVLNDTMVGYNGDYMNILTKCEEFEEGLLLFTYHGKL